MVAALSRTSVENLNDFISKTLQKSFGTALIIGIFTIK